MNELALKDEGDGNIISVASDTLLKGCRIFISGNNNSVIIKKNNQINHLFINLKGSNKKIFINEGTANINNLKIVSIRGDNQRVRIGKNFSCGGLEIQMNDGDESLQIGDDCLFSWGIKMRTSDGHSVVDMGTNKAINLPEDILISDRVWICEDVKILKGVKIYEDTIISSGAIVTKPFDSNDSNSIIAGVPAKIVKRGVKWDRAMPRDYNRRD